MKKNKKLWGILAVAVIAVCAAFVFPNFVGNALAVSVKEQKSYIRVFIGNADGITGPAVRSARNSTLAQLSTRTPDALGGALVTFDNFLSIEETEKMLGQDAVVTQVYLWMPGETGRAIIAVQDGNLRKAIEDDFAATMEDIKDRPDNDAYKIDMLKLMKSYGIFAVEVEAPYSQLAQLADGEHIDQVSPFYSEQAETLSAKTGKEVRYVCVPDKPDGTD